MKLAIVVLLVACSKSGTDCEALKTKYLAESEQKITEALGEIEPGPNKDQIVAQGKKEMAMATERFVGACKELGDKMDGTCFESGGDEKARHERCRALVKELDHKLYVP